MKKLGLLRRREALCFPPPVVFSCFTFNKLAFLSLGVVGAFEEEVVFSHPDMGWRRRFHVLLVVFSSCSVRCYGRGSLLFPSPMLDLLNQMLN
jgi:hypothetical protein